jgi:SCP-2 sterol transfer family
MEIVKWYEESEMAGSVAEFLKKYDAKDLDGTKDAEVFFKALVGSMLLSKKEEDDEDKQEMWENLETDIEEYSSLAYFIEIRGSDMKFVMKLKEDEQKVGLYKGEYEAFTDCKNNVWMDWTPATQLQIMTGNPNTDAQFFSGDLTVKGSLKLASKPRQWIYDFFDFIDREVD